MISYYFSDYSSIVIDAIKIVEGLKDNNGSVYLVPVSLADNNTIVDNLLYAVKILLTLHYSYDKKPHFSECIYYYTNVDENIKRIIFQSIAKENAYLAYNSKNIKFL